MFNIKNYYGKENSSAEKDYANTLSEIKEILTTITRNEDNEKKDLFNLLKTLAEFVVKTTELEGKLDEKYFNLKSLEELEKENKELFEELIPENYVTSYLNPAHSVKVFGKELGQLLSFFCYNYRPYIKFAFQHKIFKMSEYNQLFIDVYNYVKEKEINYEELRSLITRLETKDRTRDLTHLLQEYNDPEFQFYTNVVMNEDLEDLRYLFKYGKYISKNEILLAEFWNSYPKEKISMLVNALFKAFIAGFERDGKKLVNKSIISFEYSVGMERLLREVMREFEKNGLKASVGDIKSSDINQQVSYDHKFYRALFLNEEVNEQLIQAYNKALENNKMFINSKAGTVYIISFGEKPFNPENKLEALKLSEEQTQQFQKFYASINQNYTKYQPISETSFCVISFPSPEIGDNFNEIFDEIVKINMLDSERYEQIQQIMIDTLDKADHVIIKGKEGNQTVLQIKLQNLENPEKETNFVNSGADVNIPLGEVYTTPQLKGTSGILHVKETHQNSVLIKNLRIQFRDGYVEDFSCTNFETEDENRQYVEQNLLFPHKTLPMGEFAIGTNTLAYVISRKYDILDVLPILIAEKTAPHFAVGDTCFQMREDVKSYNKYNKKLVTACDNEKSILRKTEKKDEAYTFKHNDIVLPFDDIDHITAVRKDNKKITIIRDGKFTLKGTKDLNIPLIEFEKELLNR